MLPNKNEVMKDLTKTLFFKLKVNLGVTYQENIQRESRKQTGITLERLYRKHLRNCQRVLHKRKRKTDY